MCRPLEASVGRETSVPGIDVRTQMLSRGDVRRHCRAGDCSSAPALLGASVLFRVLWSLTSRGVAVSLAVSVTALYFVLTLYLCLQVAGERKAEIEALLRGPERHDEEQEPPAHRPKRPSLTKRWRKQLPKKKPSEEDDSSLKSLSTASTPSSNNSSIKSSSSSSSPPSQDTSSLLSAPESPATSNGHAHCPGEDHDGLLIKDALPLPSDINESADMSMLQRLALVRPIIRRS